MLRFSLFLFFIAAAEALFAQPLIYLENPSFEDAPSVAHPPVGWYYCGQVGESPPDIHPGGFFGVERQAQDGVTFVGMVVRDNGTHEAIGQRLSSPLAAGQCYSFSIYAARSEIYQSVSRLTGAPTNYENPAALYIWGGFANCDRRELLARTSSILDNAWKQYTLSLHPAESYTHLLVEAYYSIPGPPYNGNVLIDLASPLALQECADTVAPPEDLELFAVPRLQSEEELRAYLQEQGRQIRFSADGIMLEQHLFTDSRGIRYQTNGPLWKMARA